MKRILRRIADRWGRSGAATLRELQAAREDLRRAQIAIETLMKRHYSGRPLPSENVRKNVSHLAPSVFVYHERGACSSERVLEAFGTDPGEPVLDWGCGSGRTRLWLQAYPRWREMWHGCDVDEDAIRYLKTEMEEARAVHLPSTLPPLPYPAGMFSGLFGFSVLTHIHPELHRGWYQEIRRIVRPGAKVLLSYEGETSIRDHEDAGAILGELRSRGWIWRPQQSLYYDYSVTSEAFTRRETRDLFTVESYQPGVYFHQDLALLRAV